MVDLNEISALLMDLLIDVLRYGVDISHELLDVIQFVLPLPDDLFHVRGLALHLQLFRVVH